MPLVLIALLIFLKHVPVVDHLPLARAAGVVAFATGAFLALRLLQPEKAVETNGWSELHASPAEYFAVYGGAALSAALMIAIIHAGWKTVDPIEMIAAFIASLGLAGGATLAAVSGLFQRIRWNHRTLVHRSAFGRLTELAWADVEHCEPSWRGVVISTRGGRRVTYSALHAGAAELAAHATYRARRNAETASQAFASV
ncbi:hypothetical protein GCM10007989_34210 [Devosia pacifica]|uniref:Uncharacterized protein n=1 Tax=Devosia pacifica TaxID=1335967 RepID=A0A918VW75_9HYPH|nr:hypothetical protein GCM10007989_34210 [Devosia pacifica]